MLTVQLAARIPFGGTPIPVLRDATSASVTTPTKQRNTCMFESLDEQMKRDDNRVSSAFARMIRYALYALGALLVFDGLIFAVHLMS